MSRNNENFSSLGVIAIYKPSGPTSNDIVQQVKKITGIKKVGHAGTLDPLAKGVLVLGIGRDATKKLGTVVQKEKEYIATIRLGQTSSTDDEEGVKEMILVNNPPNISIVSKTIKSFEGNIEQTPPIYSAIKVNGKEAYKYARKGKEVNLRPRPVLIKEIELLDCKWPDLKIRVVTGPGVYIRSLARDIGIELSTGGYLKKLERIRVGEYTKDSSVTPDQLMRDEV
ncbi:tRNA pseudouridine(55) synthase TruB [Patescibacteria group bacterium]|nr:tRNA pseudouridine(55) synthase TruB [Patescibacteria group bacterium]MBU1890676.1 tRNA pseudouridine(55) synthase TruB [Patescibacteria group bacterium]